VTPRCWLLLLLLLQDGQEFLKLLLTKLEHTFAASCQQVGGADQQLVDRMQRQLYLALACLVVHAVDLCSCRVSNVLSNGTAAYPSGACRKSAVWCRRCSAATSRT
jgi:hypothetical protein